MFSTEVLQRAVKLNALHNCVMINTGQGPLTLLPTCEAQFTRLCNTAMILIMTEFVIS